MRGFVGKAVYRQGRPHGLGKSHLTKPLRKGCKGLTGLQPDNCYAGLQTLATV